MTDAPFRLEQGGRINRDDRRAFRFDDYRLDACGGDTLASALLAHGVGLVARSFKLHRPRGIIAAGVEEPNALVTLREGARSEPNIQATMIEPWDGLVATSQNRWPSLGFDVMAVNDLFSRFLPAGFYYKTFMGPTRGAWMRYEPFIRRAAGLGRASESPDPDRYAHEHAFCDVLVIGAGTAGLAAALAAGREGRRVMLLEQTAVAGGQLLAEPVDSPAEHWRRDMIEALAACEHVRLLLRTTAYGLYDGNVVGALERVNDHVAQPPEGQPRQRNWTIHAERIVLATGATERPLLFANNDRPGCMLASAVRHYIHHHAVLPGSRAIIGTNNDSAYATALALRRAGATVTVVDSRPEATGAAFETAREAGVTVETRSRIANVFGRTRARGVEIEKGGRGTPRSCDLVCMAGGWTPNVHLASHRGERPDYRADLGAFVPGRLHDGVEAAGSVNGTLDAESCVAEGWRAGLAAAGATTNPEPPAAPEVTTTPGYIAQQEEEPPGPARGKVFVDLQNDVSATDVELAWREGYRSVEHLKRYTTLGMGTDQGRTSNINAMHRMATLRGDDIPSTGTTTFRPPYTPVAFGALAGRRTGRHFRPERRTPMHDLHAANDAVFLTAGPWLRIWYFRHHGPDADAAYVHEMSQVRENVGMTDVSTLGKIAVQGPDAAEFLDRVYVNRWLKLPVGRCRYGLMLRDDGFVLDDGTTSRFGENDYFLTTTTGEAAVVMSWLEFLLETAWPEMRVQLTSVTDQWAGVAVAGPNSRRVLEQALDGVALDDETLPPMGVRDDVCSDGLPVRVLRMSFSGERAYEVFTPAGHGPGLWQRIADAGAAWGITPYGLEALGALRIEKGHPVASEIDGRTTLDDLGLARMAKTERPFIGSVLRHRPALTAEDRPTMVGLRAIDPATPIRVGALLTDTGQELEGHGLGHVTSVTWSPELGTWIALAFLSRGAERHGDHVIAASPVHNTETQVEVCSPVFLDPEGERIHA